MKKLAFILVSIALINIAVCHTIRPMANAFIHEQFTLEEQKELKSIVNEIKILAKKLYDFTAKGTNTQYINTTIQELARKIQQTQQGLKNAQAKLKALHFKIAQNKKQARPQENKEVAKIKADFRYFGLKK